MINTAPISAGRALEVLTAAWEAQAAGHPPLSWMLHGRPGIGKTQIVAQLAQARNARLFDLRLTTIEPQDLRGLPYYDHDAQRTVWYRPEDLPDQGPAVLFLDELTAALPALQPTVYGLLQERRVGQHRLPDDVFIVAAGNTVEDGAVAYAMGTALSDRLVHLNVQSDATDWLTNYAVPQGLHPAVTTFLRARPDLLETSEDALRRGHDIACSPRAWERVSDLMRTIADRGLRHVMICGTVGEAPAAEFSLVADELAATVQIDEMLATPRSKRAPLYPQTLHGLTGLIYGLVGQARAETLSDAIDILADIRALSSDAHRILPLSELTGFGFELLIRKALEQGWEEVFAASATYTEYAASRDAAGLA